MQRRALQQCAAQSLICLNRWPAGSPDRGGRTACVGPCHSAWQSRSDLRPGGRPSQTPTRVPPINRVAYGHQPTPTTMLTMISSREQHLQQHLPTTLANLGMCGNLRHHDRGMRSTRLTHLKLPLLIKTPVQATGASPCRRVIARAAHSLAPANSAPSWQCRTSQYQWRWTSQHHGTTSIQTPTSGATAHPLTSQTFTRAHRPWRWRLLLSNTYSVTCRDSLAPATAPRRPPGPAKTNP